MADASGGPSTSEEERISTSNVPLNDDKAPAMNVETDGRQSPQQRPVENSQSPPPPPTRHLPRIHASSLSHVAPSDSTDDVSELHRMNWPLLDPPRWGWTAAGGVADVLTPHERARRTGTKKAFLRAHRRKRDRAGNLLSESSVLLTDRDAPTTVFAGTWERTRLFPSDHDSHVRNVTSSLAEHHPLLPWKSPADPLLEPEKEDDHHGGWNGKKLPGNDPEQGPTKALVGETTTPLLQYPNPNGNPQNDPIPPPRFEAKAIPPTENDNGPTPIKSTTTTPAQSTTTKIVEGLEKQAPTNRVVAVQGKTMAVAASPKPMATREPNQPPKKAVLKEPLEFHALLDSGGDASQGESTNHPQALDMYTYHRGREGREPRDEETGHWMTDVPEPTDTNHHHKEPDTNVTIQIQFPLSDNQVFRDTITFDLMEKSQSGTTSLQLASDIAVEFGLSYSETIDLAESIQGQLRTFHREHNPYAVPHATEQAGDPRDIPQAGRLWVAWHGQALDLAKPGFPVVQDVLATPTSVPMGGMKDRRAASLHLPSASRLQKSVSMSESSTTSNKRKRPPANRKRPKTEVEEIYVEEIKARLLRRGCQILDASKDKNGDSKPAAVDPSSVDSVDVAAADAVCHICHQSGDLVQLSCGRKDHVFCRRHLASQTQQKASYCQVCSLQCQCRSCMDKVLDLARRLRSFCRDQDSTPAETPFPTLWETAQKLEVKKPSTQKKPGSDGSTSSGSRWKHRNPAERRVVPKIPVTDFPREVSEGVDVDPATPADYQAIFSENGAELPTGVQLDLLPQSKGTSPSPATNVRVTMEDGSVDFCNRCVKPGNLLCCDFCPRAFHSKCLIVNKELDENSSDTNPWMCPSCCNEKAGLPSDTIDGSSMVSRVQKVYGTDASDDTIKLISIIRQMLDSLVNYDFGRMFSVPVVGAPGYEKIVKTPMDLGTVMEKLDSGTYRTAGSSLEDVVVRALNDVELVWQNCFLYNCEGSAVFRMAEVQRRRANAIREKSFEKYLTDAMKERLQSYRAQFGSRGVLNEFAKPTGLTTALPLLPSPQKSRHKITVPAKVHHNGRPVAVLDPDSRRIVKLYSTMSAAASAVEFLFGLGHQCENPNMETGAKVKVPRMIHNSEKYPDVLLFGYRWLFLDNLRAGKVKFSVPTLPVTDVRKVNDNANTDQAPPSTPPASSTCAEKDPSHRKNGIIPPGPSSPEAIDILKDEKSKVEDAKGGSNDRCLELKVSGSSELDSLVGDAQIVKEENAKTQPKVSIFQAVNGIAKALMPGSNGFKS
eukprot:CAMPEP_0172450268 /NCGR_PEP_ID=MMETSP1065-20121228/8684_1 /TAXON_ID=265537 /ORGANISM="Amphiprora paludosa, Strain CCMP125" /LENGTH=1280 /DNA_ID=CAMNT_0013202047 /DNA_START=99 /DNA_END=3944 /DNA_ORIENTATION=-